MGDTVTDRTADRSGRVKRTDKDTPDGGGERREIAADDAQCKHDVHARHNRHGNRGKRADAFQPAEDYDRRQKCGNNGKHGNGKRHGRAENGKTFFFAERARYAANAESHSV